MSNGPVGVGVIGCGNISEIYLANLQGRFPHTRVVAVSDIDRARASQRATQFSVPRVCSSAEELVAQDDVEIVVNLTPPVQHVSVTRTSLEAGKHVYVEKPLALDRADGAEMIGVASERRLMLACAPDTFLGASLQTAHKLVADGWIGRPLGAIAHLLRSGPESWHPDPEFLYKAGAGPLWDSGPYFITALGFLLGPLERVMCSGTITLPERTITSEPHYGETIKVEVPTLFSGILSFEDGAMATLVMSVDVYRSRLQDPRQHDHTIELYGTEGTLSVPSPCHYDGQIYYCPNGHSEWAEIPAPYAVEGDSRGIGVADMSLALTEARPPRLSAEMAFHTLDALVAMEESMHSGRAVGVASSFETPDPMPLTPDPRRGL